MIILVCVLAGLLAVSLGYGLWTTWELSRLERRLWWAEERYRVLNEQLERSSWRMVTVDDCGDILPQ